MSSTRSRGASAATHEAGQSNSIRVLDLFCGTGALSFGLTQADQRFQLVAGVDADEAACATAAANHPDASIACRPIADVDLTKLVMSTGADGVDVIVGGPPCQGFSSLRPSRGTAIDDPRNRLYRDFQEAVALLRPKAFLLENVVGLVNGIQGSLLDDLLHGFQSLGYIVDWRILNAASYGVPQKRERFLLLGALESQVATECLLFPQPTHVFSGRTIGVKDRERLLLAPPGALRAVSAWQAMSDLPPLKPGEEMHRYAGAPRNGFQRLMRAGAKRRPLSLHQAARHNEKMQAVMKLAGSSRAALPDGLVTSGYSSCYSRISPDEPAPTVTVKFTSPASSKCIHPFDDRAITPREAARLQSFPDNFVFQGSKTEIAAQIGNAVPPLLAGAFAPTLAALVMDASGVVGRAS